jgi:hypothetical protein
MPAFCWYPILPKTTSVPFGIDILTSLCDALSQKREFRGHTTIAY